MSEKMCNFAPYYKIGMPKGRLNRAFSRQDYKENKTI